MNTHPEYCQKCGKVGVELTKVLMGFTLYIEIDTDGRVIVPQPEDWLTDFELWVCNECQQKRNRKDGMLP